MLLIKEKTYTISEFVDYLNTKDLKKLDLEVGKFLCNKKLSKMLVTITASLMNYAPAFADSAQAASKIGVAGQTLFGICQSAAYWVCLVMCAIEIIRALMSADTKSVSKIIAKYLVGFGAIYFLPWAFDMIRDIFS